MKLIASLLASSVLLLATTAAPAETRVIYKSAKTGPLADGAESHLSQSYRAEFREARSQDMFSMTY